MLVECGVAKQKYFIRNEYMKPEEVNQFRFRHDNIDVYVTPYFYEEGVCVEESKLIGDFYLDFDKDLKDGHADESVYNEVRTDALRGVQYLQNILCVPLDQISIYFSGGKGFHLIVPKEVINLSPTEHLNHIYKMVAEDASNFVPNKTIDLGIYDRRRLLRMPNSRHGKTNLYKIPITLDELKELSFDEIKALAREPRAIPKEKPKACRKIAPILNGFLHEWERKREEQNRKYENLTPLQVTPPCIKNILNSEVMKGQRNNTATALCSFFKQQGLEDGEAKTRLLAWSNEHCDPPISSHEIDIIVKSIYTKQYKFGCGTLKSLTECIPENCQLIRR